jgi:hypothetical protein
MGFEDFARNFAVQQVMVHLPNWFKVADR